MKLPNSLINRIEKSYGKKLANHARKGDAFKLALHLEQPISIPIRLVLEAKSLKNIQKLGKELCKRRRIYCDFWKLYTN